VVLARVAEAMLDVRTELVATAVIFILDGFGFLVGQRACRPHTHHPTLFGFECGLMLGRTEVATAVINMLDGFGCFWAGNHQCVSYQLVRHTLMIKKIILCFRTHY